MSLGVIGILALLFVVIPILLLMGPSPPKELTMNGIEAWLAVRGVVLRRLLWLLLGLMLLIGLSAWLLWPGR